jgi:hypothetical protein
LASASHLRQDEVGGAVDDPRDPLDAVRDQPLAQGLDDGDAATDGGLEGDHHVFLAGGGEDLVAMDGEECLVRGDHVLAVRDRLEGEVLRDAVAADQLDDDVDLRIAGDRPGVVGDRHLRAGDPPREVLVQVGDAGDDERPSHPAGDLVGVAGQHRVRAAADGADAEQADADGSGLERSHGAERYMRRRSVLPRGRGRVH